MRSWLIFSIFAIACCEGRPEPVAPTKKPEAQTANPSPGPTSNRADAVPTATTATTTPRRDAGTPPLASPNPKATSGSNDAPKETEAPRPTDPQTRAIERVAIIARGCYEKNVGNVDGSFALRLTMGEEGKITRTIVKSTDGSSINAAFERCLVDGLQKDKFPSLASNESLVEIPLQFKKH